MKMFLQCFEQCLTLQRKPARSAERLESVAAVAARHQMDGAKVFLRQRQYAGFGIRNADVIDEFGGAKTGQLLLKFRRRDEFLCSIALSEIDDCFDVEIKRVQEQTTRRAVGTQVRGVVRKQCLQRIDADNIGAAFLPLLQQRRQVGEVADAPIALRFDRVELRRSAPDLLARRYRRRCVAARGAIISVVWPMMLSAARSVRR